MTPADLEFPVWTIFRVETEMAAEGQPITSVEEKLGKCMHIFTDTDLAQRFIDATVGDTGKLHILKKITTLAHLNHIAKAFKEIGCLYVAVDSFFAKRGPNSHFIPIEEFASQA